MIRLNLTEEQAELLFYTLYNELKRQTSRRVSALSSNDQERQDAAEEALRLLGGITAELEYQRRGAQNE